MTARNKRARAMLMRLMADLGDVRLSEASAHLSRRGGRPPAWNVHRLVDVFLGVEALKDRAGLKPVAAWHALAEYSKLSPSQVEHAYRRARRRFAAFKPTIKESIDLHLEEEPRLAKFIDGLCTAKTRPK